MITFSEYVSLGHPDKIADYISQYLLDRYIEKDADTRYAVEVQIKNYRVTLGGEVSSKVSFTDEQIADFVKDAVNEIGYTIEYAQEWGFDSTICGDMLDVAVLIRQQSPDIAQGVNNDGWGDQGIFFGMATYNEETCGMPLDHALAKRLCKELFESGLGGLDIKTQIVMEDDKLKKVIVAIPLNPLTPISKVEKFVRKKLAKYSGYELIVNGTGKYVQHSSIADCGTTGRKLAVDFYGGNCKIGGGSPWTKDASKADLSLNLLARQMAKQYADTYECDAYVSLACCIGKREVDVLVTDKAGNVFLEGSFDYSPAAIRKEFGLDKPIYASMCRWGLFGEFQADKEWEKF